MHEIETETEMSQEQKLHRHLLLFPSCSVSSAFGQYRIILFGDNGTCVNNLSELMRDSLEFSV